MGGASWGLAGAVLASLGSWALVGCAPALDPCLPSQSVVRDLRILAVRSDPPEAEVGPSGEIPPVRVTALVAHPSETFPEVAVSARLCLPGELPGTCAKDPAPVDLPDSRALGERRRPDPSFDVQATRALLETARARDPLGGVGGVRLLVEVRTAGDGPPSVATKLLLYRLPDAARPPSSPPNLGLVPAGMRVQRSDGNSEELLPRQRFDLEVGELVGLRPRVSPAPGAAAAAEEYDAIDLSGRPVRLRERITYDFFTTPRAQYQALRRGVAQEASIQAAQADEPEPGQPDPPEGLVRLSALGESAGRVWVVVRDGRGAVAWTHYDLFQADLREGRRARLEFGCE